MKECKFINPAEAQRLGQVHLASLAAASASELLDNADGVELRLLHAGDQIVPLAICTSGYKRASCLSPTGHYLSYPIHEIARRSKFWTPLTLHMTLAPLSAVLAVGAVEQVIYVNHWLTVGGPALVLDQSVLRSVLDFLVKHYPRHAIIFSNIVPATRASTHSALAKLGCTLIPSRRVWIFDPARPLAGKTYKNIRDCINKQHNALLRAKPRRLSGTVTLQAHVPRLLALYRDLYISKHSGLNPQYSEKFFRLMLASPLIRSCAWRGDNGDIESFSMQMVHDGKPVWALHGYDLQAPKERRLNQIISAGNIQYARSVSSVFNFGGGADYFKYARGAVPVQEFDAVYTQHLPVVRQFPWCVLKRLRPPKAPLALCWDKLDSPLI